MENVVNSSIAGNIIGRVACPFICLGSMLVKLALRILVLIEPILITPIASLILAQILPAQCKASHGLKNIPYYLFDNLIEVITYTFYDLAFQGIGSVGGMIFPSFAYHYMHYDRLLNR